MSTTLNYGQLAIANKAEWLSGYVTLPAFSYTGLVWAGASQLITQFNFTATKNFTIKTLPTKPTGVNFCLVVRYRIGGQTYRYKLWEGVGEVLNERVYAGQIIKKNFVLEVWSTQPNTEVSLATAFNLALSIRKIPITYASLDNYEDDAYVAEVGPTGQILVPASVIVPSVGLIAQYISDNWVAGGNLIDEIGNFDLVKNGVPASLGKVANTNYNSLEMSSTAYFEGPSPFAPESTLSELHVVMLFRQNAWTLGQHIVGVNPAGINYVAIEQRSASPNVVAKQSATISAELGSFAIASWDVAVMHIFPNFPTPGDLYVGRGDNTDVHVHNVLGFGNPANFKIGGASISFAECLCYNAVLSDIAGAVDYLLYKYGLGLGTGPVAPAGDVQWLDNP